MLPVVVEAEEIPLLHGFIGYDLYFRVDAPVEVKVNSTVDVVLTLKVYYDDIYVFDASVRIYGCGVDVNSTLFSDMWLKRDSQYVFLFKVTPREEGFLRFIISAEYYFTYLGYMYFEYGAVAGNITLVRSITYSELVDMYNRLKSDYESLLSRYGELQRNYTLLLSRYNDLLSNYTLLLNMYQNLSASYGNLYSQYSQLVGLYSGLAVNYSSLLAEYRSLREKYDELSRSYVQLASNYSMLVDKYAELSTQHKSLIEDYNKLLGEYGKYRELYSYLAENYSKLADKYSELLDTYTKLREEHAKLEKSLSETGDTILKQLLTSIILIATTIALSALILTRTWRRK
jgi:predicted nuclease with TOPRIM domain